MDEHAKDREMNGVREKHESDSEHYRQHCRLISVGTPLYRDAPRDSHRELVSETAPRSREGDEPLFQRVFTMPDDVCFGERERRFF